MFVAAERLVGAGSDREGRRGWRRRVKLWIGLVLMLVGGGVIIGGGAMALLPLVRLYRANLEDPMDQPEGAERATSDEMLRGVIIGAIGVPFFIAGSVMVKAAMFRKLRGKD